MLSLSVWLMFITSDYQTLKGILTMSRDCASYYGLYYNHKIMELLKMKRKNRDVPVENMQLRLLWAFMSSQEEYTARGYHSVTEFIVFCTILGLCLCFCFCRGQWGWEWMKLTFHKNKFALWSFKENLY